jgi:Xaa-Pro aminopeptidase
MLAYVLQPGESAAPAGLRAGMAAANAVQDALVASFRPGITGNMALMAARQRAVAAGLNPIIYTHPIGLHGHGAGAPIGTWENQAPIPARGDYPIQPDTAWSIELAALARVPEWGGQEVRFPLEVDGHWDGRRFRWIDGRQTELLLIPRPPR